MESITQHLNKLREERQAREKARIEKLRELNLKKYGKDITLSSASSNISVNKIIQNKNIPKNNLHLNNKRPITAPVPQKKNLTDKNLTANNVKIDKQSTNNTKIDKKPVTNGKTSSLPQPKTFEHSKVTNKAEIKTLPLKAEKRPSYLFNANRTSKIDTQINKSTKSDSQVTKVGQNATRKSFLPRFEAPKALPKPETSRKSLQPQHLTASASKPNPNRQSVFERLYQPKIVHKKEISDVEKIKTDPNYLRKVIKNTSVVLNKRHTLYEPAKKDPPVRRSISAVHLKRINKNELNNCFHKWASIGDKLENAHLTVDEDAAVKDTKEVVVSAVKSERKKVKFLTPIPANFNTPRPEELQARLQKWLQKRGKSLNSFHHLQCFGIHLSQKDITPVNLNTDKYYDYNEDEDKENKPLSSDSDNESFEENMNNKTEINNDKWRRASMVSESVDFNETREYEPRDLTLTPSESGNVHHVDELLLGALNDLTELLKENYEWEQCARWLRSIRERFPSAVDTAAYWECRAALEERRGDLPASVHCWEEAIAKGTERSVVEANLDQLLTKFMQLKISPNSGKEKQSDRKMVDVKNVFKSTLIRFAVQQAKLRQSQDPPKYLVTPVRRSGRLSLHNNARTPLQVCTSMQQAGRLHQPLVFVPNDKLCGTP